MLAALSQRVYHIWCGKSDLVTEDVLEVQTILHIVCFLYLNMRQNFQNILTALGIVLNVIESFGLQKQNVYIATTYTVYSTV